MERYERVSFVMICIFYLKRRILFLSLFTPMFLTLSFGLSQSIGRDKEFESALSIGQIGLGTQVETSSALIEKINYEYAPDAYKKLGIEPAMVNLSVIAKGNGDILLLRSVGAEIKRDTVKRLHEHIVMTIVGEHKRFVDSIKVIHKTNRPLLQKELELKRNSENLTDKQRVVVLEQQLANGMLQLANLKESKVLFVDKEIYRSMRHMPWASIAWSSVIALLFAVIGVPFVQLCKFTRAQLNVLDRGK